MVKFITVFMLSFVLLFWAGTSSFGQNYSSKSKYSSYRNQENYDRIDKKIKQAEKSYPKDANKALDQIQEALLESIKADYTQGAARSHKLLADINYDLEEYRLAYSNYKKAHTFLLQLNENDLVYEVLPKLGKSAEEHGLLEESMKYYESYLQMAKERNKSEDQIDAQNAIARVFEKQGKLEQSEKQLKEALSQSKKTNNKRAILNSTKQLGKIKEMQKETDEAIDYYQESQKLAYELKDNDEINVSYNNISNAYRNSNDLDNSIAVQQQAEAFNANQGDVRSQAKNNLEIANDLLKKNDNPGAIEHLQKNFSLVNGINDLESKSQTFKALSQAYKQEGQKSKADQMYQDYLELQDSLIQLRGQEQMDRSLQNQLLENIQNKMLVLEKDKELDQKTIELLQNEKKLREEQIQFQKWISYALGFIILVLIVTSYLVYKSIRQKRIANQLLTLKSLRSQMNPHFIFNALNSVNNFISQSDERSANKYLSDFSRLMREVMQNSQEDFIPLSSEIDILRLYIKLEHFRFKNKFDYTFEVDEQINQEDFYIPPMLIQPYIENAVWHGLRYKNDKGFLHVRIYMKDQTLVVEIEDNGIGRKRSGELKTKNQKAMKSTGIKNIDSRLKILGDVYGAKLHVQISDLDRENQAGTHVVLKILSGVQPKAKS